MTNHDQEIAPAVRPGLVAEEVGEESVVFDTTSNQAHRLSPLAAAVFAHCDGRTPLRDLPALVSSRLGEPVSDEDVATALRALGDAGLLDGPSTAGPRTVSRRTFTRDAALATAGAGMLITTVATPAAAQASPDQKCPGSHCVSQATGDDFCACINECPDDTPGAGTGCPGHGMSGPYLDSCECLRCPSPGDQGEVPPAFVDDCPTFPFQPCTGPTSSMGCNNTGSLVDGICLRVGGDTSEPCPAP